MLQPCGSFQPVTPETGTTTYTIAAHVMTPYSPPVNQVRLASKLIFNAAIMKIAAMMVVSAK